MIIYLRRWHLIFIKTFDIPLFMKDVNAKKTFVFSSVPKHLIKLRNFS